MIKFQVSKPVLAGREREYVLDAIDSGWVSSTGAYIQRFEKSVADVLGVEDCIAVSNGTVSLHLACMALGLEPGKEVIMPALTYVATANSVAYCGGVPVLADCDPGTWNMRASDIEPLITKDTVGVIAVHLYGLPCDVEEIAALCAAKGLWLIEDCAESLGATVGGRATGSFGDAACFSFYGNKVVTTGEGGMLVMRDPALRAQARLLRGQGMDPKRRYWHPVLGYNYRLTNVAAAIGCGQIEQFDYHIGERRRIAKAYRESFHALASRGVISLPALVQGYESSYWLFCIVLAEGGVERRARIMERLEKEHGIETRPFFVPMHELPMYEARAPLPNAEFLGHHGINLPSYSGLSDTDVRHIAEQVTRVILDESEAKR